jgi:hypothetical protein
MTEKGERTQVTVGMSEELRMRLENAARQSVRSLSGEIIWRLENSFEHNVASSAE